MLNFLNKETEVKLQGADKAIIAVIFGSYTLRGITDAFKSEGIWGWIVMIAVGYIVGGLLYKIFRK